MHQKMKNRDVSEAIIVNERNEVLLQKKTADYKFALLGRWLVFGGEIRKGESPEQTLKRELKEEINFDIKKFNLLKVREYALPSFGVKGKRYIFEVIFNGELSQISLREGSGFGFFSSSELGSVRIPKIILEDLKEYFKNKSKENNKVVR